MRGLKSDSAKRPDVLIVAGEESSDRIAAAAVRALLKKDRNLRIHALGGPELKAAGADLRYPLAQGGVVGFAEVLGKLSFFLKARKLCMKILKKEKPRLLVLVDSPDFNLPLAVKARALGIPVLYYVCPQVWAWRRGRVDILRRCCRQVLCIFPFEPAFLKRYGVQASYVGHPLLEKAMPRHHLTSGPRIRLGLLPGSRVSEVERILPIMALAAKSLGEGLARLGKSLEISVFQGAHVPEAALGKILGSRGLEASLEKGSDLKARAKMDLSLVASGTAALETALLGSPMIVVYKVKALTGLLAKVLVRVPHVAMPNIILERRAYPEFIQADAQPLKIAETATRLLMSAPDLRGQGLASKELRKRLAAGPHTSQRVAEKILAELRGSG